MANYSIYGCIRCGKGKSGSTHTYGTYRVYHHGTVLKLVCKTCQYTEKFRYIDGGV